MITSYSNMPVGTYRRILEVARQGEVEEATANAQILAILNDMSEDDIFMLPLDKVREMAEKAAFLLEQPKKEKVCHKYDLTYHGKAWRLILQRDYRNITYGQYMDCIAFGKEADKHLVELLSCALVPEGCKYGNGYDLYELQEALREALPITTAQAVTAFFLSRSIRSLNYSRHSLVRRLLKISLRTRSRKVRQMVAVALSLTSGDGWRCSKISLGLPELLCRRQALCQQ